MLGPPVEISAYFILDGVCMHVHCVDSLVVSEAFS